LLYTATGKYFIGMDFYKEYIDDLFYIKVTTNKATFWEADYLQEILQKEIALGFKKIIVDLTDCKIIDPAFIGAVILNYKRLINLNGTLKIIKPEKIINEKDNIINSLKLFELFNTKIDAVDSFKRIFVTPVEDLFYPKIPSIAS